jgi:hypothetical protein
VEIFDVLVKHLGVRFVYEKEDGEALDPAALADMSPDWATALRQATTEGDLARILDLIEQVRERDVALAEGLVRLAYDFDYDAILELVQQGGSRNA